MADNRARKTAKKTATGAGKLARPSPRNGVQLPVGAHPGNTGGKAGRSGRKPDAFREALADIRDAQGIKVLTDILAGRIVYRLAGKCEHCGKISEGDEAELRRPVSLTPDVMLRASEMTMKYTVGQERTIRLRGPQDVANAFELIKVQIRAKLPGEEAETLIEDITHCLRTL